MDSSVPSKTSKPAPKPKQAIAAKIFHWVNIISLLLMITSGLQIYNANPVFGGEEAGIFRLCLCWGVG
ncbi:MAG TPA: hypothetical protein V6D30_10865 [Leptolyngbyaceae cyanobacterium]